MWTAVPVASTFSHCLVSVTVLSLRIQTGSALEWLFKRKLAILVGVGGREREDGKGDCVGHFKGMLALRNGEVLEDFVN